MKYFLIEIQIEFTTQKISINYLAMSTLCCIFAHSQSHRLWRGRYRPAHPSAYGFGFRCSANVAGRRAPTSSWVAQKPVLMEEGVIWPVSERLRWISENISKLVQVSPKNSNFFGEWFIVFECRYGVCRMLTFVFNRIILKFSNSW